MLSPTHSDQVDSDECSMEETKELNSLECLIKERKELKKKQAIVERVRTVMRVAACVFLSATLVAPFFLLEARHAKLAVVAGVGNSIIAFSFVLIAGAHLNRFSENLQDLNFEIDLNRYNSANRETRAEKLLRINTTQLRRYYDLNLHQNKWMFGIGIGCILLGFVITGCTVGLIVFHAMASEEKIIAAVLGGVGSFLTNFVAAMYLKMNSTAAQSLTAFHTQLVKTHELLMSNLLISSINNDDKRWATLSDLALRIAGDQKYSWPESRAPRAVQLYGSDDETSMKSFAKNGN